ncbi:MAG TPA: YadA-like family protein, partial [Pseudoxanthomonas sp.]|nr:YadA-like family protein [Pseudoxanthomonas sp.]
SRNGAMSAAMMQMAANGAYAKPDRGRLAMGAGVQDGEAALSIGYGRRIGDSVSFSLGAAFSDSESAAGVGFGVDL